MNKKGMEYSTAVDLEYTLIDGALTKSIGVEDGETEITVENPGSNSTHGFGTGSNTGVPIMNQTIVVEAKPLESVEAFGVKASSSNIVFAVMAVIVMIACWRLLKKWY